jgi:hypothetical protein
MNIHAACEIKVWHVAKAPESLRRLAAGASEWIAFIPADLVSPETEALFLRWDSQAHPVLRCELQDGSVVLAGSYPASGSLATSGSAEVQSDDRHVYDARNRHSS